MKKILKGIKTYLNAHKYQKLVYTFLAIVISLSTYTITYAMNTQQSLSKSVVRLHVLANSDSDYDQNVKIAVKDEIICKMKDLYNTDILKKDDILTNLDKINDFANKYLKANNIAYTARIEYGIFDFPTKKYDNIIFPKGEYEAVRIILGEGSGQNWWCVMFPPLCLIDTAVVEPNISVENDDTIPKSAAEMITLKENGDTTISFKIVEIVQNMIAFCKR